MRIIPAKDVEDLVCRMALEAGRTPAEGLEAALTEALACEVSPTGRQILGQLLENIQMYSITFICL